MKLYADISKTEQQDDGTIKVWGYASTEAVDSDGETITADAMKAALPDYMKFGAVREMHQAKAAGTAIEAEVKDDGRTWFGAHVVDSEAVKKVNAGVYKGFSIGGKVTDRDTMNKSIIKGIKLVEVSLVDRPANPEAVFTMFKAEMERTAEDDVAELAEILNKGEISPAAILELIKKGVSSSDTATEKVADEVKKGMGHVAELAYTLKQIMWFVKDQMNEAAREGDGSDIPAKLNDWLSAGTEILKEMVAEETAELTADTDTDTDDGEAVAAPIFLAARALAIAGRTSEEVTKAGKALSAKSMAQIKTIHDASAALGACALMNAPDPSNKHDHAEDLAKAEALADNLKKTQDALSKAEGDLTMAKAEIDRLKALPAHGKALLKAVAVGKTDDKAAVETELNKSADKAPSAPETTDPLELIKAAQMNPRFISLR